MHRMKITPENAHVRIARHEKLRVEGTSENTHERITRHEKTVGGRYIRDGPRFYKQK